MSNIQIQNIMTLSQLILLLEGYEKWAIAMVTWARTPGVPTCEVAKAADTVLVGILKMEGEARPSAVRLGETARLNRALTVMKTQHGVLVGTVQYLNNVEAREASRKRDTAATDRLVERIRTLEESLTRMTRERDAAAVQLHSANKDIEFLSGRVKELEGEKTKVAVPRPMTCQVRS